MPSNTRLPREEVLWKIFHSVRDSANGRFLPKPFARERVLSQLADEYGVEVADITAENESTIYTIHSKLMRLLYPVSQRARTNLDAALADGISFNHALLIARGRFDTKEEILAAQPSKTPTVTIRGIPLADLFAAIISTARSNGFDADDIQTAFNDAYDAYEAENA
jgi:hypothetical protein